MHIRRLTIQGFKSYRDVVAVDPFSEKVNIVVGRNGAGKSNFFAAIRFVLSDAYTSLNRAERQDLLHDGTSTAATFSAFVEIVFDNSDGRIPTGKNEVILRRTIGAKKDDYSLDRKSTSKAEVMSLLESAGFSRSNPFFIVPQGRITSLTNQKDAERLELLKEIAGTRVYEDRKTESEKIMAETEQKQVKIDELLEYIDGRLEELEEEKKELKEYQVADKDRRASEYCIYQHQLEEAKEALDEIEAERNNEQQQAEEMRKHSAEREAQITETEQYISNQREKLDLIKLEKEQLEADQRENIKAKTNVELTIRDLEDASERTEGEREALLADRRELEEAIASKEGDLASLDAKYTRLVEQEAAVKKEIEQAEAKQQSLFAKQGRAAQFRTQAERDRYLRTQIASSKTSLEGREKALDDVETEIESTEQLLSDRQKREVDLRQTLQQRREDAKKYSDELNELNGKLARLNEERKECWKADEKLTQTLTHARDELKKAENALRMTMDRATQQGLEAVERVAARFHLVDKVHGPLYKLFEHSDTFKTAIENIANNSLFHVVVDDDETASRILEVMVKERLGRVTFMPLNRLRPPPVTYPEQEEEAIPLINRLRFDEKFRPAMQQVFSKAIIVQNLNLGAAFARSHGLTAITLQGDKQDKKGALTGGFHDSRRSRLETVKSVKQWKTKYDADATQQAETRRSQVDLDQQISKLKGQIIVAETRLRQAREAREPMTRDIEATERDIEQNQNKLADLKSQAAELTTHISQLKIEIAALEDELRTPMANALTDAEAAMLAQLGIELQQHRKQHGSLSKDRQALAAKKSSLEIEIGQNLRRKRDKVKEKIDMLAESGDDGSAQLAMELTQNRATLESLTKAIATTSDKLRGLDKEMDKVQRIISDSQKDLETLQTKQVEESRGFAKQQKNVERFLAKRQLLMTRKDESSKKIRELGAIPPEAFEKQKKKLSMDRLAKDLHKANEKLKKFTGVNKRAFDQFTEFTNQREELASRREELNKSEESIRELIDHLDMRKDEAIERTFKQVSKNFVEVFETLVPAGKGRLIMQRRIDDLPSDEEEDVEPESDKDDEEDEDEDENDEMEDEEDGIEVDDEDTRAAGKKRRKGGAPAKAKNKSKSKASTKKTARQAKSAKKGKSKSKKQGATIEAYSGISIKVSFNSKSDEGLRIQQLSGGQKSLVALALIFSIQKCDPAPFYLFDEIDANLDADRRTAVASMIRSLADSAQFIITTFRPELLASADNFFGVMFDNRRVSTIQKIGRDHAYEFVESASAPTNAGPTGR